MDEKKTWDIGIAAALLCVLSVSSSTALILMSLPEFLIFIYFFCLISRKLKTKSLCIRLLQWQLDSKNVSRKNTILIDGLFSVMSEAAGYDAHVSQINAYSY